MDGHHPVASSQALYTIYIYTEFELVLILELIIFAQSLYIANGDISADWWWLTCIRTAAMILPVATYICS